MLVYRVKSTSEYIQKPLVGLAPREECKVSAVTTVMLTAEAMTRTPPSLATL